MIIIRTAIKAKGTLADVSLASERLLLDLLDAKLLWSSPILPLGLNRDDTGGNKGIDGGVGFLRSSLAFLFKHIPNYILMQFIARTCNTIYL